MLVLLLFSSLLVVRMEDPTMTHYNIYGLFICWYLKESIYLNKTVTRFQRSAVVFNSWHGKHFTAQM